MKKIFCFLIISIAFFSEIQAIFLEQSIIKASRFVTRPGIFYRSIKQSGRNFQDFSESARKSHAKFSSNVRDSDNNGNPFFPKFFITIATVIASPIIATLIDRKFKEGDSERRIKEHWHIEREHLDPLQKSKELKKLIKEMRRGRIKDQSSGERKRVIFVDGPGGAGKSVLSKEVVWQLREACPREHFLGHYFRAREQQALEEDIQSFAKNLGMQEDKYSRATKFFISQQLNTSAGENFIIIFDDVINVEDVFPYIFDTPDNKTGIYIVTTRDENCLNKHRPSWEQFNLGELDKVEAEKIFQNFLEKKLPRDQLKKEIEKIQELYPQSLKAIADERNNTGKALKEPVITADTMRRIRRDTINGYRKVRPDRASQTLLYGLSMIANSTKISYELLQILYDDDDLDLEIDQLLKCGILESEKRRTYIIHQNYQDSIREAYLEDASWFGPWESAIKKDHLEKVLKNLKKRLELNRKIIKEGDRIEISRHIEAMINTFRAQGLDTREIEKYLEILGQKQRNKGG